MTNSRMAATSDAMNIPTISPVVSFLVGTGGGCVTISIKTLNVAGNPASCRALL